MYYVPRITKIRAKSWGIILINEIGIMISEECNIKRSVNMYMTLKKHFSTFLKGWGYSLIIALLIGTSVKSSLADWNDVPTGSMEPTILIGDRIFVNKLAYDLKIPYTTTHLAKWADPKCGDIVVFFSPKDGTRLVKRVVALPEDTIAMHQNKLFTNGKFAEYAPLNQDVINQFEIAQQNSKVFLNEKITGKKHAVMLSPSRSSLNTFSPMIVPEGQYFMMGDNRDNSFDSRYFGFVDRSLIVGRATMVAASRYESFLSPRWSRFFKELI
jgi:signal peptidase I